MFQSTTPESIGHSGNSDQRPWVDQHGHRWKCRTPGGDDFWVTSPRFYDSRPEFDRSAAEPKGVNV